MTHLNETIYGAGIAARHQGMEMKSGAYLPDEMLANVCKHNVTRLPVRDRPAGPGPGRRADGDVAVGARTCEHETIGR